VRRARVDVVRANALTSREREALSRAMATCEDLGSIVDERALTRALEAPERQIVFVCARGASDGEVRAYAYAASDGAMVATIERVCVRESDRGKGLGRAVMRALGEELGRRGIYDVGARVPSETRGFFERANYDDDETGAVLMRFERDLGVKM